MENLDKLLVFTMNHPEKCRKKHMGGLPFYSYLQEEINRIWFWGYCFKNRGNKDGMRRITVLQN